MFTRQAIARPDVRELFYGFESLDASDNVDEFKFRMGFKAVPMRQRIVFHPAISPLIRPALLSFVVRFGTGVLHSPKMEKTAGMIRFYLIGRQPLSRQAYPSFLQGRPDDLKPKMEMRLISGGEVEHAALMRSFMALPRARK